MRVGASTHPHPCACCGAVDFTTCFGYLTNGTIRKIAMGKSLTMSEARDRLADVIGQVQFGGERVTISKRGRPVAVVVSVADAAFLDEMEDRALGELARARPGRVRADRRELLARGGLRRNRRRRVRLGLDPRLHARRQEGHPGDPGPRAPAADRGGADRTARRAAAAGRGAARRACRGVAGAGRRLAHRLCGSRRGAGGARWGRAGRCYENAAAQGGIVVGASTDPTCYSTRWMKVPRHPWLTAQETTDDRLDIPHSSGSGQIWCGKSASHCVVPRHWDVTEFEIHALKYSRPMSPNENNTVIRATITSFQPEIRAGKYRCREAPCIATGVSTTNDFRALSEGTARGVCWLRVSWIWPHEHGGR